MPDSHHDHEEETVILEHEGSYNRFLELLQVAGGIVDISADLSEAEMKELSGLRVEGDTMTVDCIDEGVSTYKTESGRALQLGIGGGGILLDGDNLEKFADFLLAYAEERGYKKLVLRSHRKGCGAAKLACGESDPAKIDQAADGFIEKLHGILRQKKGDRQIELRRGVVEHTKMIRPEHLHNAFGAVVDTTGKLNITRQDDAEKRSTMPPMFNVSAIYENDLHALANLGVALDIASGSHGLAHNFSVEKPFIIAIATDSQDDAALELARNLEQQINDMIAQKKQESPGKWVPALVKIVNFAGVLK